MSDAIREDDIERVYSYDARVPAVEIGRLLGPRTRLHLVKREDKDELGQIFTDCYLELTEEQHAKLLLAMEATGKARR
jgi:hypothetical protein